MPYVFVDTAHHIAVFNADDSLHIAAVGRAQELTARPSVTFVTSHLVMAEFLASASRAAHLRVQAAEYVRRWLGESGVTVVALGAPLFERGLDLYQSRHDKSYSLTDCVSMVICRDMNISDVLTSDHDFEQEGFNILLRAPK